MRFQRLDLLKFGKFSGRSIEFPAASRDFHLIVGPNEAGKSTLRSAILDLLFGIPTRSPHGFRHPLSELRLGALISGGTGTLEFHRAKAQKQTLRTPADAVLPDAALAPYLGSADRAFFDQMFGLDHTRLVEGGNSILSAANDVGQVLFQSAAGVASLGRVRDALLAEAEQIWTPRKAASRSYYAAQERLDQASTRLKESTVRTKVWADANGKVDALRADLDAARAQLTRLQVARSRLERVRRLAPLLRAWRESEVESVALGTVAELPVDAEATLVAAEREQAVAGKLLELRTAEVEKAQSEQGASQVDAALLALSTEIEALERLRVEYGPYAQAILHRHLEIAALWQGVGAACAQLDWPCESEQAVTARLPKLLVRRELGRLAREFSGLQQGVRAAETNEQAKRTEIESLTASLNALPAGEVKPGLRAALAAARAAGDTAATGRTLAQGRAKVQAALGTALGSLGTWRMEVDALKALVLPGLVAAARQSKERQALVTDLKAAQSRHDEQAAEVGRLALEIKQFTERHHPSTQAVVAMARLSRDEAWKAIRSGATSLDAGAERFEGTMHQADHVADARLDDVAEATQLQSLLQQAEREQHALAAREGLCTRRTMELARFDAAWAQAMADAGLAGMSLEDLADWLARRDSALAAAVAAHDAQTNIDALAATVDALRTRLAAAMRDAGLQPDAADDLADLCVVAETCCKQVDETRGRRDALAGQVEAARVMLAELSRKSAQAQTALATWRASWATALTRTGLAVDSEVASVEGALELIGSVEEKLGKMREIRSERIDTMNADLKRFEAEAAALAVRVAPDLTGSGAALVAQSLAARLAQAKQAQAEGARLKTVLRVANERATEAREAIQRALASLTPLKARAGVESNDALRIAIGQSDRKRLLESERAKAEDSLQAGGDGLARAVIETEIDGADLPQLTVELARIDEDIAHAVQRQSELSAAQADAARGLAEIGGSEAAAIAEAMRQEALAQMAEAAERYVKVYTAGRLLRWSIDRYREEKQGPLLRRAGAVFAALTLGSFTRLAVDFDKEPMELTGQRADGERVGIAGMSDGTRDQLYLALRLAAVELHLAQATPLPFIADDLFINYDDARARAGLQALGVLAEKTQVIFLSHHEHLIAAVRGVFGDTVNVTVL